jgi:hypothetical protein
MQKCGEFAAGYNSLGGLGRNGRTPVGRLKPTLNIERKTGPRAGRDLRTRLLAQTKGASPRTDARQPQSRHQAGRPTDTRECSVGI